jgi:hypothetical protein
MKRILISTLLCLTILVPKAALAADARDYIPLPAGMFFWATYFQHTSATDLYNNGKKISSNANLTANVGILRPVYFAQVGPFVIDPQCLIPFGEQTLDTGNLGSPNVSTSSSGMADPVLLATIWFVNDTKSKTWFGFTPYITMPLGTYDKGKGALNLGKNRWAFKPEVGFVKGFGENFYVDLVLNGEFYTDNTDYPGIIGSTTLSQDPTLGAEIHLSYDITKNWYIALDYYYLFGGETKIAGIKQDDQMSNHALQFTTGFLIGANNQLLLQYKESLHTRAGFATGVFGARWAYFF